MSDFFQDMDRVTDLLFASLGDLAPRCRKLMVDYKAPDGQDWHQELVTLHHPGAGDAALVESIRESLAERGCQLTAVVESGRILYMAPGYLEECAEEMGLTLPDDIAAALANAGVHPVNWEELVHER